MNKILKFWKSILWAIIIAFLLLMPGDKLPKDNLLNIPYFDKVVHFILFLLLEVLLLIDLKASGRYYNNQILKFTALVIGYALLSEWLQYLLTVSRHGDWYDFIADIAGIAVGWTVFLTYSNFTVRSSSRS